MHPFGVNLDAHTSGNVNYGPRPDMTIIISHLLYVAVDFFGVRAGIPADVLVIFTFLDVSATATD